MVRLNKIQLKVWKVKSVEIGLLIKFLNKIIIQKIQNLKELNCGTRI